MPWINSRFYANPLFGRGLERARIASANRVWSEEYPELEQQPAPQPQSGKSAAFPSAAHPGRARHVHHGSIEGKASVGYAETAGLTPQKSSSVKHAGPYDRSKWDKQSLDQLREARRNIMDISERNGNVRHARPGKNAGSIETSVWNDNLDAAEKSNGSMPGHYFFIRQEGVGNQRPPKKAGYGREGKPIRSYGPFVNVGGGDVPRGNRTYIDIYDR